MLIQLRKVTSSRYPLGYTIELQPTTGSIKATRHIDGEDVVGYYVTKAVAIKEQADWYADTCIQRDREASAKAAAPVSNVTKLANHLFAKGILTDADADAYIEAGGHLSSNPAQCGCGDCLTYMAGE